MSDEKKLKTIKFLEYLFFHYLERTNIKENEFSYHLNDLIKNKSFEEKEVEFKCCKESQDLIIKKILEIYNLEKKDITEFDYTFINYIIKKFNYEKDSVLEYFKVYDPRNKICINYSGHVRNYNIFFNNTNEFFLKKLKADVFIHTWEDYGFQNKDTRKVWLKNDHKKINLNDINHKFKPKKILTEDQFAKLNYFGFKENKKVYYFEGQAKDNASKYINAQLYSINKSNSLKSFYENKEKIKYDICIRMRFDFCIDKNIDLEHLSDILYNIRKNEKILYIANPKNTAHGHPGGGGGCKLCKYLYNNNIDSEVLFSHAHENDICDIIIIGSSETMDYYSSLYFLAKKIYDENSINNEKIINEKNISFKIDKNMCYIMKYDDIENNVFCYYPEKLLRKFLEGYILLDENVFFGKIRR
jgi:hypothetical protein